MEKKYELTDETLELDGHVLHRIRALRDFGDVREGDLGGFVESEENLSHEGDCWVRENAKVYGDAKVSDKAKVCNEAKVYGDAEVRGDAWVCDNVRIDSGRWERGVIEGDMTTEKRHKTA